MPYSNLALDADRENGPASRSFAADAHDCIMSGSNVLPNTTVRRERCAPNGELPSDPQQTDRQAPTRAEAMQKPVSRFIIAPRAQASKPAPGLNRGRCETQAALRRQAA